MTINYLDTCADLYHCEHVSAYKQVKDLGGIFYVGVHSDATIISYKRHPIMSMEERITVVEACRYVDKVIPNAPLRITEEFLDKHNIDMVCTQERTEEELELMYSVPRKKNMLRVLPKIPRIVSTGRIIKRVLELNEMGLLDRRDTLPE